MTATPATLLYIGTDEDARADLAFVPGEVQRADTIADAHRYLIHVDPFTRHVIAYGPDVAAAYRPGLDAEQPIDPEWGPLIVLTHGEPPAEVWRGAVALRVEHVVELPAGWDWLLRALAGPVESPSISGN